VADSKTLKLLLVEDDLEDEVLLSEALIEIEEQRQWCNWHTASAVHVDCLADALHCLRQERFDAVLLNLSLPDSPALLDSFFEVKACARGAPIVVLADEEDESLANRLLREGAQDVLLKPALDCGPLAHSLRYAIERERRATALRSAPFVDDLTGVLTREGFLAVAGNYVRLSRHTCTRALLALLELAEPPEDREECELLIMRAAEALRDAFEIPAIIGRLGRHRFGVIPAGMTEAATEALLMGAARQVPGKVHCWVAGFDPEIRIEEQLGEETAMLAD